MSSNSGDTSHGPLIYYIRSRMWLRQLPDPQRLASPFHCCREAAPARPTSSSSCASDRPILAHAIYVMHVTSKPRLLISEYLSHFSFLPGWLWRPGWRWWHHKVERAWVPKSPLVGKSPIWSTQPGTLNWIFYVKSLNFGDVLPQQVNCLD